MFIMLVAAWIGLSIGLFLSAIFLERIPMVPSTIPRYFTAYEGPWYFVLITEKFGETFRAYRKKMIKYNCLPLLNQNKQL